ncbi:ABC transporter [Actinopolymorpha pittospori]|uniref:ABC-2 type transport system permease protein n=1 Tax=Actinopolymorpha pittospori TaxID=648752 RepID=A0A927N256_9ACTN|nr:ABC transporter [Actinopolymorpha pittospori]MBE1607255.1 ABC-2 type transport system permease protein [Actinopolymorpha pittospori]
MSALLTAELTKVRTLPSTWIALALTVVANTVLGVLAATDTVRIASAAGDVAVGQLGTLMLAPVYVFVAIAVFAAGTEYRGGQLRVSLAAAPDRTRWFGAKLAVSAAVALVAAIPAVLPGLLVENGAAGDLTSERTARDLLALLTGYLLLSLVGFGFAFLARGFVTPLAVLVVLPVLVSTTIGGLFPQVVRFLPHEATLSFLGRAADPATTLGRGAGLLVLTGWALLFVGAAWALVVRRDT